MNAETGGTREMERDLKQYIIHNGTTHKVGEEIIYERTSPSKKASSSSSSSSSSGSTTGLSRQSSRASSSESESDVSTPGGGGGRVIPRGGKGLPKGKIGIRKIGSGIAPPEEPTHIQFGKHLIHANNLRKSVLSLHHKGGGRVASIPVQNISEDMRDFIGDILQNKKASQKEYSRLPIHEQKLFEKFSTGAGVFHNLGLKSPHDEEDKKNIMRFEVLKGEWIAGNNSHELVRELRKLVIYFMEEGRLTKAQGRDLLLNIN